MKAKRPGGARLHIYQATKSFNLAQQKELLNEFVYCEMDWESSKKLGVSKIIKLDPANLVQGSKAVFWEQVAKNATQSPAFLEKEKVVIASTAKSFCEESVDHKRKRMEKGETHEGAYLDTGTGGSDDEDGPPASRQERRLRAAAADISYEIEELLHVHVSKILEREIEEAGGGRGDPSAASGKIAQGMAPVHSKKTYDPPAPLKDLENAALHGSKNKKAKHGGDTSDLRAVREKQVQKHVTAQGDFNALVQQGLTGLKKPTAEESIAVAQGTAQAYVTAGCSALDTLVTKGIEMWKKPVPESPKPPTALRQMSCAELWAKICEVGTIFKNNSKLQAEIATNGIDGAMLAFMSDADILEFFMGSCEVARLQASMLLAKIKFWNA